MTKEEIEKMAEKTAFEVSNICNPEETNLYFRMFRKTLIAIRLELISKTKAGIADAEQQYKFLDETMHDVLLAPIELEAKK